MSEGVKWQYLAWAGAAVLLALALIRLTAADDHGSAASSKQIRFSGGDGGSAQRSPDGARAGGVYVHVAGAVRAPGVYRVPKGSRVAAAVRRARGLRRGADGTAVNLAQRVQDGQQVVVPAVGAGGAPGAAAGPGATSAGAAAGSAPVNLSSATVEQLDGLDGIGPTLAQRIVEYRDQHGGSLRVGDLRQVDGIGEKRFSALRDAVGP